MFVYTCRAGTIRFFAVIVLAAAALAALVIFVPAYQPASASVGASDGGTIRVSYDKIRTNEDRIKFLAQFGYEVAEDPLETVEITLPEKFDKVSAGYNELQKSQGLDLSKYRNKTVTRYTFVVTNYPDAEGTVLANVLVFRRRVIGGDICSADVTGFVVGFNGN